MADLRDSLEKIMNKQGEVFSFLIAPESYLLTAGLLSGLVSIPLLMMNIVALHCVVTACSALQDESNNPQSWLFFEGLTAFFLFTCIFSLVKFARIQRERNG